MYGAFFSGKITGGSAESPADITFTKSNTGWTAGQFFVVNPDNDFYGDIWTDGTTGARSLVSELMSKRKRPPGFRC